VSGTHSVLRWFKALWLWSWPLWILLVFASLAAVGLLPGGPGRAAIAAPILLIVPGSLTLGAIFSRRSCPRGTAFICYAALLSAVWSGFASLAIYVSGASITAANTYGCLLIISTVLAIVAESRLLLGGSGTGRRAVGQTEALDPDLSDDELRDASMPAAARRGRGAYYGVLAVVAGVSLLAGGLYVYDYLPHPPPVGYTWMAWTGPQITGDIAVGSVGVSLKFQIIHHQSDTTNFRLSAAWLGSTPHPLAKPLTLSIGPDQTFRGAVFIPPLPNGCTYRIEVALTAARQIDPLTKKPQTWSINANVRDPNKSSRTCK
jgi:hypothetical protein